MKKTLCSMLMVLLLVSCFVGTVNAAERASGKFDVTVKAGELKPAKNGFPMAAGETVTIALNTGCRKTTLWQSLDSHTTILEAEWSGACIRLVPGKLSSTMRMEKSTKFALSIRMELIRFW